VAVQFEVTKSAEFGSLPVVAGINPESLIVELKGKDRELMLELGSVFLRQETLQRRTLLDCIFAANRRGMAAAAHSLRGSLFIFGADAAAEIVEEMEETAEEVNIAHAYERYERLEVELAKLSHYIKILMAYSPEEIDK
jgi:hypothetical protein